MNIWAILFLIMGAVFLLCWLLFSGFKERAARFVSGFNTLSKAEQEKYDRAALSRDMAKMYAVCTAICLAGVLLCQFLWKPLGWFVLAGLLVWFFAHVKLDPGKAFKAYRLDGK